MSNRGRQNVASYLVLDMGIDWRVGADHFESYLLDHDVCSNYGNWNAAAGLTGGRVNKFNPIKQSNDYDSNGDYIRHWIPELKDVPVPLIFNPTKLSSSEQSRFNVTIGMTYPKEAPSVFSFGAPNNYEGKGPSDGSSSNNRSGGSSRGGSSRGGSSSSRGGSSSRDGGNSGGGGSGKSTGGSSNGGKRDYKSNDAPKRPLSQGGRVQHY